ncbi:hypothetical protein [Ensifer sp. Root127]|uniref:hypothetical protein n=1 Tax=Ensifer sp. Root127 TaxID=1736440 RepID=UPI00070E0420|nr:hypothetical protein [Ensifer sp. Root127]KQW72422.1 hypothetical protein ASD03_32245 [Ensifer sp. Root127]
MDPNKWKLAIAGFLRQDVPSTVDYLGVARKLIEWNGLVSKAPLGILTAFDSVAEPTIAKSKELWIAALTAGSLPAVDFGETDRAIATRLVALTRALDEILLVEAKSARFAGNPDEWIVDDFYVIPRKTLPPWRKPKLKDGYGRRGVLRHRILPRTWSGLRVLPTFMETMADHDARPPVGFGAAFFSGFSLKLGSSSDGTFFAEEAYHDDARGNVEHQLDASGRDGCFNIVWPELTVPGTLRDHIVSTLKANILKASPASYPDIVVAGSWHEDIGGARRNVARIYNGFGSEKVRHEKVVRFYHEEVGDEDIESGGNIPVLVTDNHVVAFGICKDFCGQSTLPPYLGLNVDCVLVPSMGDDRVAAAHRTAAEMLRNGNGARAFVVQQMFKAQNDVVAFVLPPNAIQGEPLISLKSGEIWRAFSGL